MLILGQGALARPDGSAVLALARDLADPCGLVADGWTGFNVLHLAAARVAGLDIGFVPGPGGRDLAGILDGAGKGEIEAVYLLGADELDMGRLGQAFVIYQGHHGDTGAHRADVVLPGAAYTEKDGIYVNTEGRVQLSGAAVDPPGDARADWTILRALSEVIGHTLPYDDLDGLRETLVKLAPSFGAIDRPQPAEWQRFGPDSEAAAVDPAPFVAPVANFYMTDPISRASETMAECVMAFGGATEKTGTDG